MMTKQGKATNYQELAYVGLDISNSNWNYLELEVRSQVYLEPTTPDNNQILFTFSPFQVITFTTTMIKMIMLTMKRVPGVITINLCDLRWQIMFHSPAGGPPRPPGCDKWYACDSNCTPGWTYLTPTTRDLRVPDDKSETKTNTNTERKTKWYACNSNSTHQGVHILPPTRDVIWWQVVPQTGYAIAHPAIVQPSN